MHKWHHLLVRTRGDPLDVTFRRLAFAMEQSPRGVHRQSFTAGGDKVSTWEVHVEGRCQEPKVVLREGRPPGWTRTIDVELPATPVPTFVEYHVPCRRCEACRRQHAKLWRDRARKEILYAQRTWFCTFTFKPERRFHYRTLAAVSAQARGVEFDTLSVRDQFSEIATLQANAFRLAIKRLRKNRKVQVRYLLVCESHVSGDAHLHALLHEREGSVPVLKAELQSEWHSEGFSQVKLVQDDRAAWYVSKYLAKSPLTRIRASLRYGTGPGHSRNYPFSQEMSPNDYTNGRRLSSEADQAHVDRVRSNKDEVTDGIPSSVPI